MMIRYVLVISLCCWLLISCQSAVKSPPVEETVEPEPAEEVEVKKLPIPDERMKLVIDPQGHSAKIQDVMFSPDGSVLISVSNDKTIRVWDTETGTLLNTIRGQIEEGSEGKLYAGALSPDGRLLAVGGFLGKFERDAHLNITTIDDLADFEFLVGQIRVIDLERGEQIATLKGHTNVILDLAFSPDGHWLASASADKMVRVWDLTDAANPELIGLLEGHAAQVQHLAFSPDRRQLVSASSDGTLRLWELPDTLTLAESVLGLPCSALDRHADEVRSVIYSPDGKYIVSGGKDRRVLLWNSHGKFVEELAEYSGPVATMSFSADGSKIVVAGEGDFIPLVYAIPSGEQIGAFTGHINSVVASAFFGNEKIATAGADHAIYLWDAATGSQQARMVSKGRTVWQARFGDGLRVAFGTSDFSPEYFNDLVQRYPDYFPLENTFDFGEMNVVPFSSLNEFPPPLTPYQDSVVQQVSEYEIFLTQTGAAIHNDPARDGKIRAYTMTPQGEILVGSSFSLKSYTMYGDLLRTFVGHTGEVFSVLVSQDGRVLASSSDDQTIKLWNSATGECLVTLFVASDGEWVCWTPQGYYTASQNGERYIGWHLNQGMDRAAVYHPASVFRKLFHHPDIVRHTIEKGSFQQAFAEFKSANQGNIREYALTDITPPAIRWQTPSVLLTKTPDPVFHLEANVWSHPENPVTNVTVFVNDEPYVIPKQIALSDMQAREVSYDLTLSEPHNSIALLANSELSSVVSELRLVELTPQDAEILVESEQAQPPRRMQARLALVIGNAEYLHASALPNPVNDARSMEHALRELGFEVMRYENATLQEMKQAIDLFGERLRDFEVGAFFYSGHGAQVSGQNYIIPIDANLRSRHDVEYNSVNMGRVMNNMDYAENSTNIVILDACRDNPFTKGWSKSAGSGGLAFMDAPSGTLIAYATSPGKVAFDDPNSSNSIYTAALLQHIGTPNLSVLEMFQQVRSTVMHLTNNTQTPWESTSLTGNFYFMPVTE